MTARTRTAPAVEDGPDPQPAPGASRRRALRLLTAALTGTALAGTALAACGKKGDPGFPPDAVAGVPNARRDESKVYPD